MCMDEVIDVFLVPTYQIVTRWKVFRTNLIYDEELFQTYYSTVGPLNLVGDYSCPRGIWLLSNEMTIGERGFYSSGFHVLVTERDAEEYCGAIKSYGNKAIKMEMMVMGLKATGRANIDRADYVRHPDYVGCEVYDWMYIPAVDGEKVHIGILDASIVLANFEQRLKVIA